ncbi:MAG: ATPase central domain protein [Bacteriovoracaceae bacterium]|nr:ATPase central domain protein [Bacteriovoracaceae bacterium]
MSNVSSQKAFRKNSFDEAKRLIASKYPIVWIESWEEERVEQMLKRVSSSGFSQPLTFSAWSETKGFGTGEKTSIIEALELFISQKESGILLIKDFSWNLAPISLLKRTLRDLFQQAKSSFKTLFLLSAFSDIPEDTLKEIITMDFALPDETDLQTIFEGVLKGSPKVKVVLNDEQRMKLLKGALGLTGDEAKFVFQKMMVGKSELSEDALEIVFEEKARIIKREGLLEYVPTKFTLDDIGGLDNLKDWLKNRSDFFSKEAQAAGLKIPKGVLMTGVSGCGKSLSTQAIAAAWGLPLYRLDMNRVYGGAMGAPEEAFRKAISQIEAVAPAILWLEEIEKGVAGYEQGDKGVTARIFSSFLTWLQEHSSPVFVAATANEINKLPPELLRKGRFDEIFFVDLPSEAERGNIFKVHIAKRNLDATKYVFTDLAKATNNFNGAEIEQVVVSGLVLAFQDGKRELSQDDMFKVAGRMVPLATTMSEQIKEIKRWADTRAVKASR